MQLQQLSHWSKVPGGGACWGVVVMLLAALLAWPGHAVAAQAVFEVVLLDRDKWRLELDLITDSLPGGERAVEGRFVFRQRGAQCVGALSLSAQSTSRMLVLDQQLQSGQCVRGCSLRINPEDLTWSETCPGQGTTERGRFTDAKHHQNLREFAADLPKVAQAAASTAPSRPVANTPSSTSTLPAPAAASPSPPAQVAAERPRQAEQVSPRQTQTPAGGMTLFSRPAQDVGPCGTGGELSRAKKLSGNGVFACTCASGTPLRRIWGDAVYTGDSDVCTAAQHMGIITDAGGKVYFELLPGHPRYEARTRNDISSWSWTKPHSTSFRFGTLSPSALARTGPINIRPPASAINDPGHWTYLPDNSGGSKCVASTLLRDEIETIQVDTGEDSLYAWRNTRSRNVGDIYYGIRNNCNQPLGYTLTINNRSHMGREVKGRIAPWDEYEVRCSIGGTAGDIFGPSKSCVVLRP